MVPLPSAILSQASATSRMPLVQLCRRGCHGRKAARSFAGRPAAPPQQTYNMQQPISNDPISAFPPRNLFSNPSQPRGSDEQQQPDPFDDDLDLSGELGVFEQLDAIKFLLQHFDIQQADPVLFERLKRRTFTVPHAVEQLIKEDAYFSSQLARFYAITAANLPQFLASAGLTQVAHA